MKSKPKKPEPLSPQELNLIANSLTLMHSNMISENATEERKNMVWNLTVKVKNLRDAELFPEYFS